MYDRLLRLKVLRKWDCCPDQYLFKLKQGHHRNSVEDLEVNNEGDPVLDHSTGCRYRNQHDIDKNACLLS